MNKSWFFPIENVCMAENRQTIYLFFVTKEIYSPFVNYFESSTWFTDVNDDVDGGPQKYNDSVVVDNSWDFVKIGVSS